MTTSEPLPRVVRVSNVADFKQTPWIVLLLLPFWLFCAYYEVPRLGTVHAEDAFTVATACGFMILLPFIFLIPPLQLLVTATWIADNRGIEFIPYAPRLRRWRFLTWDEIDRVKWSRGVAVLSGGGDRISIVWKHVGNAADAELLKRRVEASLRDHFDLTITPPRPSEISWRRILRLASLPTASVLALYALAMGTDDVMLYFACLALTFSWAGLMYAYAIIVGLRQNGDALSPTRWRMRGAAANVTA